MRELRRRRIVPTGARGAAPSAGARLRGGGGRLGAAADPGRCPAAPEFRAEHWLFGGGRALPTAAPAEKPAATLVLVHGYHSDAAVWDGLLGQLQLSGTVRVLRVCYRTVDRHSLTDGATALAELVKVRYPPDREVPLYFIGHSFGGLVLRQMLADDAAAAVPAFQGWPQPITVMTIDTPHHGTPASLFELLTGESILRLMSEVREMRFLLWFLDNPVLRRTAAFTYLEGMQVHTITGQYNASPFNAYLGAAMLGASDGVVPSRSAHLDPLHRDRLPPEDNHLGGSPFGCAEGSRPGWRRYVFTAPIYQQDVFHTRINTENAAVAQIVTAIIRGGGQTAGIQCVPFTPGGEGYRRRLSTLGSMAVPLLLLIFALRYIALPPQRRATGLLAHLSARLPEAIQAPLAALRLPPEPLDWRYGLLWGLTATLTAIIPSWGLTMGYYAAGATEFGRRMLPVVFVAAIALAEQAGMLYMFHRFLRHEQGTAGADPEVELECRSYGWLFGLIAGVAEQAIFAISVGGNVAWSRAIFGIAARVALGYAMGWLYGRLVAAVEKPLWQEFAMALLPLAGLHTAYAALFVHVLSFWEALIILAASLAGPAMILWLAGQPQRQRAGSGSPPREG